MTMRTAHFLGIDLPDADYNAFKPISATDLFSRMQELLFLEGCSCHAPLAHTGITYLAKREHSINHDEPEGLLDSGNLSDFTSCLQLTKLTTGLRIRKRSR